MTVPPLTLRIPKGSPLTALEGDDDFKTLRDFCNGLSNLFGVSLNPDGSLKNPAVLAGTSAAGSDAYVLTFSPAPANIAALTNKIIIMLADVANTGPATLNVNGFGPIDIKKFKGEALESNDIKAGQYVFLSYDGTNFQMQSFPGVTQPVNYAVDTGAVNALAVAQTGIVQAPSAYFDGYSVVVKVANTNTAAVTLQIGALGAVPLRPRVGIELSAGSITVGQIISATYAGGVFYTTSVSAQVATQQVLDNIQINNDTQWLTTAHGLGAVPTNVHAVIKNTSAENGYIAGDEVPFPVVLDNANTPGLNYWASSTQAGGYAGNTLKVPKKDLTTTYGNIDLTKWVIKLYLQTFV